MVGIAGKVLTEAYGIRFLGVKTDRTKGFYWEIPDRPPKNPAIPRITRQLGNIKDIKTRREMGDIFYVNIVKEIAFRRFDPCMTLDSDFNIEDTWERHCSEIWSIFSDNEPLLGRLLDESGDVVAEEAKEIMKQMMVQYREENVQWFASINGAMRRLIEANRRKPKGKRLHNR